MLLTACAFCSSWVLAVLNALVFFSFWQLFLSTIFGLTWCSALLAWCEPSGCFVLLILSSTTEPPAFVCKELSLKLTQCITGTAMHGDQPRYVTTSDVWLPLGSYLRKLQANSGREVHMLQLHCLCQILLAINNALQAPHPHKILNCCCMHCCKLSCW